MEIIHPMVSIAMVYRSMRGPSQRRGYNKQFLVSNMLYCIASIMDKNSAVKYKIRHACHLGLSSELFAVLESREQRDKPQPIPRLNRVEYR